MEISFDQYGNLTPYKIKIDLITFEDLFVSAFPVSSTRKPLFDSLKSYNQKLRNILGEDSFIQWVNGSFVSQTNNPKDIDLVNLINYQLVEKI